MIYLIVVPLACAWTALMVLAGSTLAGMVRARLLLARRQRELQGTLEGRWFLSPVLGRLGHSIASAAPQGVLEATDDALILRNRNPIWSRAPMVFTTKPALREDGDVLWIIGQSSYVMLPRAERWRVTALRDLGWVDASS